MGSVNPNDTKPTGPSFWWDQWKSWEDDPLNQGSQTTPFGGYWVYGAGAMNNAPKWTDGPLPKPPEEEKFDPLLWKDTYSTAGAQPGWRGMTPNKLNKTTQFYAMLNAMIPFLSPEDQRSIGTALSRYNYKYEDKEGTHFSAPFKHLDPNKMNYPTPPSELTTQQRTYYTSAERARQAQLNLERMANSMGVKVNDRDRKLGPGYVYLKQVTKVLQDFGAPGSSGQTRRQQLQLLGQLDTLLKEGQGGALAQYGSIAARMAQPFFSARQLVPVQQADGTYKFGTYNQNIGG